MTQKEYKELKPGDILKIGRKEHIGYHHFFDEDTEAIYIRPHESVPHAVVVRQGFIEQSIKICDLIKITPNE